jgi:hypothetical protein
MRISYALSLGRCCWLALILCRPPTEPKLIGTEHVAILSDDLAAALPNRGVAMVYLHKDA